MDGARVAFERICLRKSNDKGHCRSFDYAGRKARGLLRSG